MSKNQTNYVFTKVFSFLGLKLASMQALFHFLCPLLNFFGQVMHFCKFAYVDLINAYFKFLQTLSLVVVYSHALEKHDQNKFPKSFHPNLKFHI